MLTIKFARKDIFKVTYSREQEESIHLKSERISLLEGLLKKNNIKFPSDEHGYNLTVENFISNKKTSDKIYMPYQIETDANNGIFHNNPSNISL